MVFDMTALAGGVIIGGAAALLLVSLGRVAGISGIVWRSVSDAVSFNFNHSVWRIAFIVGLIVGPVAAHAFLDIPVPRAPEGGALLAVLGGLVVGLGTRLGSGCTSGHGICGMARFSARSIVATLSFIAAGFVVVFVIRHVIRHVIA